METTIQPQIHVSAAIKPTTTRLPVRRMQHRSFRPVVPIVTPKTHGHQPTGTMIIFISRFIPGNITGNGTHVPIAIQTHRIMQSSPVPPPAIRNRQRITSIRESAVIPITALHAIIATQRGVVTKCYN